MDSQSRILRHELNEIGRAIAKAAVGPDYEREVLKLVARREALPHLIAAAERDERHVQERAVRA